MFQPYILLYFLTFLSSKKKIVCLLFHRKKEAFTGIFPFQQLKMARTSSSIKLISVCSCRWFCRCVHVCWKRSPFGICMEFSRKQTVGLVVGKEDTSTCRVHSVLVKQLIWLACSVPPQAFGNDWKHFNATTWSNHVSCWAWSKMEHFCRSVTNQFSWTAFTAQHCRH